MGTYSTADHTFVVCAYGNSPYLEHCLESLLHQTIKTHIIISTSTPNEHIRALASKFDIQLFVSDGPSGIAQDWNRALSHVTTSLATIAHQDDEYLPGYASAMIDLMNIAKHPLISFSNYGELRNGEPCDFNKLLRIKRLLLSPLSLTVFWDSKLVRRRVLSLGSAICCPAVTLNLDNVTRPVFSVGLKSNLDWQAWERLSRFQGSFAYTSEILMRHRIHEDSETSALIQDDTRTQEDLAMFECFWPTCIAKKINSVYSSAQKSNG